MSTTTTETTSCARCARFIFCAQHDAESYADMYAQRNTEQWTKLYQTKLARNAHN